MRLVFRSETGRRSKQGEQIDRQAGLAEVLKAIGTLPLQMLAEDGVFLSLERAEQVQLVDVI